MSHIIVFTPEYEVHVLAATEGMYSTFEGYVRQEVYLLPGNFLRSYWYITYLKLRYGIDGRT